MPTPRTVYECVHCRNRFDTEDGAITHEGHCPRNPKLHGCHTCAVGPRPYEQKWRCPVKHTASTRKRCEEWRPVGQQKPVDIERLEPGKPRGGL